MPRDASLPVARNWMLEHAPPHWSATQAQEAVSQAFQNVLMLRQQRTRHGVNFYFNISHATEHDVVALPFDTDDGRQDVFWCRWAPTRARTQAQTIRTRGSWTLLSPKDPFQESVTTAVPAEAREGADTAPASSDTESTVDGAPSPGQDGAKPCRPKPPAAGASAKRQCLEQRSIPKGMVRKAAPLDGNCLFHAASMAIAAAKKASPVAHTMLRAQVADHLQRNFATLRLGTMKCLMALRVLISRLTSRQSVRLGLGPDKGRWRLSRGCLIPRLSSILSLLLPRFVRSTQKLREPQFCCLLATTMITFSRRALRSQPSLETLIRHLLRSRCEEGVSPVPPPHHARPRCGLGVSLLPRRCVLKDRQIQPCYGLDCQLWV